MKALSIMMAVGVVFMFHTLPTVADCPPPQETLVVFDKIVASGADVQLVLDETRVQVADGALVGLEPLAGDSVFIVRFTGPDRALDQEKVLDLLDANKGDVISISILPPDRTFSIDLVGKTGAFDSTVNGYPYILLHVSE